MTKTPDTAQEVLFRVATTEDVPQIVDLVQSVYRGETSKKGWTTEADLLGGQRTDPDMILNLLNDPECVFLIGELGGKVVASVLLEKKRDYVYLGMLSVDVTVQNLKLGRRTLDEAELYAKNNWNLSQVKITVIPQRTELVAWYKRRGYVETGKLCEFPSDPRFGIPKVSGLHFIELAKKIII